VKEASTAFRSQNLHHSARFPIVSPDESKKFKSLFDISLAQSPSMTRDD